MKYGFRWIVVAFVGVAFFAACSSKQPPIFDLISLYQQGKYDEAIALAEQLAAENPDDTQAYRFMIRSAIEKKEEQKYRDRFQDLIQAKPGVAGYHFALGYIDSRLGDYDSAISQLQKAIELNPNIGYARYSLGKIYLNPRFPDADPEKALAYWKEEEQLNPKSLGALQVYTDRADYHLRTGKGEAAEKDYEKITMYAFAPGDIAGARALISRLRALRDELARLEAEVEKNPGNPEIRFELGVLQYKNNKGKDAIATWLEAVELDPENAQLRNYLGKALLEDRRFSDATLQLTKAVELDPNDRDTILRTARLLYDNDREPESRPWFERAYRMDSSDDALGRFLGALYIRAKDYESAVPIYEILVQEDLD